MAKFGHLTWGMTESLVIQKVLVNGKEIKNVFELDDKEGWVRYWSIPSYGDLNNDPKRMMATGEVEIIWDE